MTPRTALPWSGTTVQGTLLSGLELAGLFEVFPHRSTLSADAIDHVM